MRGQLEPDETELRELTDSALRKPVGITDEQFISQNRKNIDFGKHARSFMNRKHGHYCKVCGEYKSNEIFSGSGHAAYICKKCAALPAAQRSEEMIPTKL